MQVCTGIDEPQRHILVVMISTECRKKKPYTLPVQCVLYTGMSVTELRRILNKIVAKMVEKGMKVTGKFYLLDKADGCNVVSGLEESLRNEWKCVNYFIWLFQGLFQMGSLIRCE